MASVEAADPATLAGRLDQLITLQSAVADSPYFRQCADVAQAQLEELEKWVDSVQKGTRGLARSSVRLQEHLYDFKERIQPSQNLHLLNGENAKQTLETVTSWLDHHGSSQLQMSESVGRFLQDPFSQFDEGDFSRLRELRRQYERLQDRYDTALAKYSMLSTKTERAVADEEAMQLYETRRAYLHACLEYTAMLHRIHLSLDWLTSKRFVDAMMAQVESVQRLSESLQLLKPRLESLHERLTLANQQFETEAARVEATAQELEEAALARVRPQLSAVETPQPATTEAEKEGYLWKRSVAGMSSSWQRRYFVLRDGRLEYRSYTKGKGIAVTVVAVNVVLLSTRLSSNPERRFQFELLSSTKSLTVHAESEAEMRAWTAAIENARVSALQRHTDGKGLSEEIDRKIKLKQISSASSENLVAFMRQRSKTDVEAATTYEYPDPTYAKRNAELHSYFRSIPASDLAFDAISCSLQKDMLYQGKLYITQNRLCFYSSIIGFVKMMTINLADVNNIEVKSSLLISTLEVTVGHDVRHVFKMLPNHLDVLGDALDKIWKNARSTSPLPAPELYDSLYKTYHRKLSDGDDDRPVMANPDGVPASVRLPTAEVEAACEPLPEKLVDVVLPVPVHRLHALLFEEKSEFAARFHGDRDDLNYRAEPWVQRPTEGLTRHVTYGQSTSAVLAAASHTACRETQTYLKKEDYIRYAVESVVSTPNLPYGNFIVIYRYALMFVSTTESRLCITGNVQFKLSNFIKPLTRAIVVKQMREWTADLLAHLRADIAAAPRPALSASSSQADDMLPRASQADASLLTRIYPWRFHLLFIAMGCTVLTLFILLCLSWSHAGRLEAQLHPSRSCIVPSPDEAARWEAMAVSDGVYHGLAGSMQAFVSNLQSSAAARENEWMVRQQLFGLCQSSEGLYRRHWHGEFLAWLADRLEHCVATNRSQTTTCMQYEYDIAVLYERTV